MVCWRKCLLFFDTSKSMINGKYFSNKNAHRINEIRQTIVMDVLLVFWEGINLHMNVNTNYDFNLMLAHFIYCKNLWRNAGRCCKRIVRSNVLHFAHSVSKSVSMASTDWIKERPIDQNVLTKSTENINSLSNCCTHKWLLGVQDLRIQFIANRVETKRMKVH